MRILIVDSHADEAALMQEEGFSVEFTDSGEEGVSLAKMYDFDAIILDRILPDMTGFEVVRQIRRANVRTPILVLSTMAQITDIVKLLNAGADDYLTKPCDSNELVARLHALVRRSNGLAQSVITTGNITVNLATRRAAVNGEHMYLTGKEYALVELLSLRKGTTLSKETIMGHLYGGRDEPEMKIVDVFICKLRKKMNAVHAHPIETVWGRGYVLRDPDAKTSMSMAAEVASLADDPPTGFVSNITLNKFKERQKIPYAGKERKEAAKAVRIPLPAT